jgi:hypothetical protein
LTPNTAGSEWFNPQKTMIYTLLMRRYVLRWRFYQAQERFGLLGTSPLAGADIIANAEILHRYAIRHSQRDKIWRPQIGSSRGFIQSQSLQVPARARNAGTSIANMTGVALKSYAVIGGTGAPLVIAKLREATDKATIS